MSKHNHEPTDTEMLDWADRYIHNVSRMYGMRACLWYHGKERLKFVFMNANADGQLAFRDAIKQAMVDSKNA